MNNMLLQMVLEPILNLDVEVCLALYGVFGIQRGCCVGKFLTLYKYELLLTL